MIPMRSKLKSLALVTACAVASLASSQCASRHDTAGASQARSEAPLATPAWSRASTPQEIAAFALRRCRAAQNRADCIESVLIGSIHPAGVDRAMGALSLLVQQDESVAHDSHVYAHGIGIAAYETPETVTETFSRCTADFQSGCYHGVIQAYFADRRGGEAGVSVEKLNGLCLPYRSPDKRWLEFQCAHGIGHGLMAVESHHLLRALDSCDQLGDVFERQACWGGAYMENVVNATQPHHMQVTQVADVDAPAAHDSGAAHAAHAGHDMAGMAGHDMSAMPGHDMAAMGHDAHGSAEPFKALDPNDPLYPCDAVKEQHRQACYLMQTSAILYRNHGDFRDAATQCGKAPEQYQATCYVSLGRDANSWGRGDQDRALAYCGLAPPEAEPHCVVGLVKNIVDITSDARDGLNFCRKAPDNAKPACYHAVGQEIALLQPTWPGREQACRAADAGYIPECRRGAGLPLVPTD